MPTPPRLTPAAADRLAALESAGHSVEFGRGRDDHSTFLWARVTPHGSVTVRTVRAGDGLSLADKTAQAAEADPSGQLVASLADPFRTCSVCSAEMSFENSDEIVFACPRGDGHDVIRPL
jgi:hypothetical protein